MVDPDSGRIMDCNPWLEALIETSRAVLKKKYLWELGPPDQWDAERERFFENKDDAAGATTEVAFLKPDGQKVLASCQSAVIKAGGKSLRQLIITEENLTPTATG